MRAILHSDMNAFYATVEQHRNPALRGKPVAVAGNPENRHGIILAKSREAKAAGITTADAIWEAKQKCPELILVPPHYRLYQRYSRLARRIYYDYTNQVEPFGLDESWLDVTGSLHLFGGDARLIAQEISERIKAELGLRVSVGVSWKKVFAKFGSDTDPGDGIVYITPENYRDVVWPHPCEDLIYIGRATKRKLNAAAIFTIGDVANASDAFMQRRLGKMGGVIKGFANGLDTSPVKVLDPNKADVDYTIKSISNGLTAPHDLVDEASTKALVYLLSESVAQRLRECRFKAKTLGVHVREGNLAFYSRQMQLPAPSNITAELAREAFDLLARNQPIDEAHPIRAISVRASNLVPADAPLQLSIFGDEEARIRQERLDCAIDELRRRFGNSCVRRMVELNDEGMSGLDIKRDNTVHPVGFFNT